MSRNFSKYIGSIFAAVMLGAACPHAAHAFFNPLFDAGGGTLTAGTLTFTLDKTSLSAPIAPNATSSVQFSTTDTGSIAPRFSVTAEKGACSDAFFNGLTTDISRGSRLYYGALSSLNASTTSTGMWKVSIYPTSSVAAPSETCEVKLRVRQWQQEFNAFGVGGFSQDKIISLTLTASGYLGRTVVLNEIYSVPVSGAKPPLDREWVELYNNANFAVNIEGWKISEIQGGVEVKHTISAANTCTNGSKIGFARPYAGASTILAPSGFLVVEFCSSDRLNNSGDTVRLYTANDIQLDMETLGSSAPGKSYARIPDGVGNWVDPIPTPGESNDDSMSALLNPQSPIDTTQSGASSANAAQSTPAVNDADTSGSPVQSSQSDQASPTTTDVTQNVGNSDAAQSTPPNTTEITGGAPTTVSDAPPQTPAPTPTPPVASDTPADTTSTSPSIPTVPDSSASSSGSTETPSAPAIVPDASAPVVSAPAPAPDPASAAPASDAAPTT